MSDQELGGRYHSPWANLTQEVFEELRHQDRKWGYRSPDHHAPEFWMLIATEEFGEVARAILGMHTWHTKQEIADTIAVLLRIWMAMEVMDGTCDPVHVGDDGQLHSAHGDGPPIR